MIKWKCDLWYLQRTNCNLRASVFCIKSQFIKWQVSKCPPLSNAFLAWVSSSCSIPVDPRVGEPGEGLYKSYNLTFLFICLRLLLMVLLTTSDHGHMRSTLSQTSIFCSKIHFCRKLSKSGFWIVNGKSLIFSDKSY